jgi:predicted GNAT family acetyltransferase
VHLLANRPGLRGAARRRWAVSLPAATIHDDGERFVFTEEGTEAELTYLLQGDRLALLHTSVPSSLGGRGIGGELVRAAVARARQDGLTILPWCEFARRWLADHPDVAGSAAIDWTAPDRS